MVDIWKTKGFTSRLPTNPKQEITDPAFCLRIEREMTSFIISTLFWWQCRFAKSPSVDSPKNVKGLSV